MVDFAIERPGSVEPVLQHTEPEADEDYQKQVMRQVWLVRNCLRVFLLLSIVAGLMA